MTSLKLKVLSPISSVLFRAILFLERDTLTGVKFWFPVCFCLFKKIISNIFYFKDRTKQFNYAMLAILISAYIETNILNACFMYDNICAIYKCKKIYMRYYVKIRYLFCKCYRQQNSQVSEILLQLFTTIISSFFLSLYI